MADVRDRIERSLREEIESAVRRAAESGELALDPGEGLPEYSIEAPREKRHGDLATNLALVLAGRLGSAPRQVAEAVAAELEGAISSGGPVERVEVAGPGFINFFLSNRPFYRVLERIEAEDEDYGRLELGTGRSALVEFVSANPTGPLTIGHARGAACGDVLASILEWAGFRVEREYYFNDAGNQMNILARSIYLRYLEQHGREVELPEEAYRGDYVLDIAREIREEYGDRFLDTTGGTLDETLSFFRDYGTRRILGIIEGDLAGFGVHFDNWCNETDLHESGRVEETIGELRERGYVYKREGAVWLETTRFGDDKDRVLVKSSGEPTYFAPDIAYHRDKFERGFDLAIDILGGDHHGYISRMKAAMEALGYSRERLEIIIVQMISLRRGGEEVKMSTRRAEFIPLEDLIAEVGRDVARYFFIMRSPDSHFTFDWELALEESSENPVYYIQYGYARICSLLERARSRGVEPVPAREARLELLREEEELDLMKKMAAYPETIRRCALSREPHHLARYAHELAGTFHAFYTECQVVGDDPELSRARLALVGCAQKVLRNALRLMGLSAPEQM